MPPTIRIDDEVMESLQERAIELGLVFGTPNQTLRNVLGIDPRYSNDGGYNQVNSDASTANSKIQEIPTSHQAKVQAILDALLPQVEKLEPHNTWNKENRRWVMRPINFIAFTIADKRGSHITVTVYGEPHLFSGATGCLDLRKDQNSYSRFNILDASQVSDAMRIIRISHGFKV